MILILRAIILVFLSVTVVQKIQAQIFGHGVETDKPAFEDFMFQDLQSVKSISCLSLQNILHFTKK